MFFYYTRPQHCGKIKEMDPKIVGLVFLITVYFYINSAFAYWAPGLVRFANNECLTLDGFTGTCLRRTQCANAGGIASGPCANGIGTCCLFQGTCDSSSANNNTYFLNTNFPDPVATAGLCTFTIVPLSTNICQVRLDFLSLSLAQPDGDGNCVFDSLVITGSGSTVPVICGENSGQHMYLAVDGNNTIQLTVVMSSLVTFGRSFSIKVNQIACDCPTLAPIGCLQYYTNLSATVSSFNYGTDLNGNLNALGVAGTRQIANTNYGICVGMIPGYCSIQWAQTADTTSFTLTQDTAAIMTATGLPSTPLTNGDCITDYVVIPNPIDANGVPVLPGTDRFCGNQLATVTTSSKPFVLTVVTDGDETLDAANRGFSLTYTQLLCAGADILLFG